MEDGNTAPVESLTENSNGGVKGKWGGKRPGAGRKHGSENAATKLRREKEKLMKDRIARSTDALLNAQMQLAHGESNLYHVYYTGEGSKRQKHIDIVTDQETITAYLAGELEQIADSDEWYYIATKSPDNRAIDSLFDRAYGKPKQSVDVTSDGEKIQPATIVDLGNLANVADQPEAESGS